MSEVIIAVLILLLFFMAWGLYQAEERRQEIEDMYNALYANYAGELMAMYDIKYSKRDDDAKLDAYYKLAERMSKDGCK